MIKNHNHISSLVSASLISIMMFLSACGERVSSHGHMIDPLDIQDVVVGDTTKQDILFTLGKPSFEGAFESGKIYYVAQNMVQPAGGRKQTVSREVFAFVFDEADILQDIIVTDETTGLTIATLSAKTPTPGADLSVIDQIFSNIRRRRTTE